MNTFVWILAGAALAWLAMSYFEMNRSRGLVIALVIGISGAYFGGSIIAPLLGQGGDPGQFRPFATVVAAACAGAFVVVGDMVYERYGV